jgi:hypothetical protein
MSACIFTISYYFVLFFFFFCYLVLNPSSLPCGVLGFQMSVSPLPYIGFTNGASHSTQNLASSA